MIREVILENFMSYEYGRIPLKPGLNLICGPNGAGKSSILLGISVALGQSYTERGRRLSDLIRWGEKISRVTIVLDNSPRGRRRPYPKIRSDTIRISRYLRKDGSYWFEVNGKTKTKSEVQEILRAFNINPNNMLIIMHQNMVEEFAVVPPKEKLKFFEDAIGLTHYRDRIKKVKEKLNKIVKEEADVQKLLEKAKSMLDYWRGEYEKFKLKVKLEDELEKLKCELAWSKVVKKEDAIRSIKVKIDRLNSKIESLRRKIDEESARLEKLRSKLRSLSSEREKLILKLIEAAKNVGRMEVLSELVGRLGQEYVSKLFGELVVEDSYLSSILDSLAEVQSKLSSTNYSIDQTYGKIIDCRVKLELLKFKLDLARSELRELKKNLNRYMAELSELKSEAEKLGSKPEVIRDPSELVDRIRIVELRLEHIGDVSKDVEQMYSTYNKTFSELSERIKVLESNRAMLLRELDERIRAWRRVLSSVLDRVNSFYSEILSKIGAIGYVRLVNADDVDEAGLEILVGFRGNTPVVLDGYSQSGGERTIAIMAFLLAVQKFIKSPFRAVDEFDIHMDPRNRELIGKLLISSFSGSENVQFIAITPSPIIPEVESSVNVIFVQNVGGKSMVRSVA